MYLNIVGRAVPPATCVAVREPRKARRRDSVACRFKVQVDGDVVLGGEVIAKIVNHHVLVAAMIAFQCLIFGDVS